ARYTANGSLDPTFGSGGTVATVAGVPTGVVIQPDNKIIVVGYMVQSSSAVTTAIVTRFNSDGSLDPTFGTGGEILTPNVPATGVALQTDGKIIVVGSVVGNYNANPFIERY